MISANRATGFSIPAPLPQTPVSPAAVALLALLITIVLSMVTRLNVGVVAIALAWAVGWYAEIGADEIVRGFPAGLFLTLTGVTMLFTVVQANGTLERLTLRAMALARGRLVWIPLVFFAIAGVISSAGPGAIAAVALIAPIALATATRYNISPFLMALMVTNGANAGLLSPISSVGVIANAKMVEAGLGGHDVVVWLGNFVTHMLVAGVAYLALGGTRLGHTAVSVAGPEAPMSRLQRLTVAVVVLWIVGVLVFQLPLGLSAFVAAAALLAVGAADEASVIKQMPWGVTLMVCGMSVLVSLLERTGGMAMFSSLIAQLAGPDSINGIVAFVTGAISSYSSTSGVVLPAFLPMAPSLAEQAGGANPLAVALSINIGSSLVDVSPLSTLGALCVTNIIDPVASRKLFRQLLAWGLAMIPIGAILAYLLAPILAGL